ncbi:MULTISPECIES: sensor histidine kinase [Salegentibacter]|uniref:sensor histidine kinase n=1 Tax=Salegentibacter TaxID=143222 RepID=UPI00187B6046|nr:MULTISPECIES: HAMP domain-containing sensor histidine kinase [Salegentibacter]MBE7640766.1 sensor histidine kinase [Salegentibacter sp. BLCTC]MBI6117149.1 HAMP domain-containing histidine kinase [Salegentibacter maritimus]
MNFTDERSFNRWFIIISCFIVVGLVLWNTSIFFQRLKEDERAKMSVWAKAQEALDREPPPEDADLDLILEILNNNTSIPIIHTDADGKIAYTTNIDPGKLEDTARAKKLLADLKDENEPIIINLGNGEKQYIYYGNSPVLNSLKYYPVGLVLIGFLFIGVVYFFYTTTKSSEQNKLWAGMAKETAHQIGTPLSSLIGWTEILKQENVNTTYIVEMEKDISRLETITERFSKIGSAPILEETNIIAATQHSFDYLKSRSSKLIAFSIDVPEGSIPVMLNQQLYSWTIENLVKNAIDAMRGKGKLNISIQEDQKWAHIFIKDTGKGVEKNKFNLIFEPGHTTKKRGWGLGLSLAKRIIESYHHGRIKVAESEINKGTTFKISLRKI